MTQNLFTCDKFLIYSLSYDRGIWLFLVSLASIGTLYLLGQIVLKLTYPQLITTASFKKERPLVMPQMTFCNMNRVRKSFDKDKFKLAHLDLWNAHQKQIAYCEYKAIGEVSNAQ